MIASLSGTILNKGTDGIVVDVNGVGYHVHIPLRSLGEVPDIGERIFLHTYTNVREDALQLFGFITEEEKRLFIALIGINGIGPKLALTILSGIPVERFINAVHSEDMAILTKIPGLGRKTAARLVLELKGRLPEMRIISADLHDDTSTIEDAISALVNLGYKRQESRDAVKGAVKDGLSTIEDIIREALRHLTENSR